MPFVALLVLVALSTSAAAQDGPARPAINTLREIGPALFACWTPPSQVQSFQVTIRLSFKRTGEVLGQPAITFSAFNGDVADQKRIVGAILGALAACTPLNLSPGLGGAIAGRLFTLRFMPPSRKA